MEIIMYSGLDYFAEPHKYVIQDLAIFAKSVVETIPIIDCTRCGNPLQFKEIKAQQHHCEPCKRLVEAAAHQEKLIGDIHRANSRGGL